MSIFSNHFAQKIGPHLFRLIRLEMFRRRGRALRHPPHAGMVPFLLLTEAEALPDDEVSVTTAHTHKLAMKYLLGLDGRNQEDVPVFLPGLLVELPAAYQRGHQVLRREKVGGRVCVWEGVPRNRRK